MENTDLVELRRLMDEGGGAFPVPPPVDRAEERTVPGMGEGATIRIIRPEGREPAGVYLDIHGGGWVIGRARMSDQANLALVEKFGVATVSVDYRLAPEHPYPAGPDDCEAAAVWLVENAAAEFGAERFLIGGGSAGAHLAAVTLLRMRDRHGYTGFIGANLVYGPYDLSMTPSQRLGVGPEGGLAARRHRSLLRDVHPRRGRNRPGCFPPERASPHHASRAFHGGHVRPPAGRLALHARPLAGGRERVRAGGLPGRPARLRRRAHRYREAGHGAHPRLHRRAAGRRLARQTELIGHRLHLVDNLDQRRELLTCEYLKRFLVLSGEDVLVPVELVRRMGVVVAQQVALSHHVGVVAVASAANLRLVARVRADGEVLYDFDDDAAGAQYLSSQGQDAA